MTNSSAGDDLALRASEAQRVLHRIFSSPNRYTLSRQSQAAGDSLDVPVELLGSIESFRKGRTDRPILLPVLLLGEEHTIWYACSADQRAFTTLHAEMMAFVGPSFARWAAQPTDASADAFVLGALQASGWRCFGFRSSAKAYDVVIARQWGDYMRMLDWQPARDSMDVRSFAQLRASFDHALVVKNERAAKQAMAALQSRYSLTVENRVFLEIRWYAAFGRWDAIVSHRLFSQLLNLRLPPETYGDVWDALYEVHVRPREALGQWTALVGAYAQIQSLATPLLRHRSTSKRPSALKSFVLNELLVAQPSTSFLREMLALLAPDAFGEASASVVARVAELAPRSGWDVARSEMELERYEQAFGLLAELPDSVEVLVALLQCAKELEDPLRAMQVLQRVSHSSELVQIRERRPKLLAAVQGLAQRHITTPVPQVSETISPEMAQGTVDYWREIARSEGTQVLGTSVPVEALVESIETHALSESDVFDALLPVLIEWLVERSAPESRLVKIYLALVEALCLRDQLGDVELDAIRLTAVHVLAAGPNAEEYSRLLMLLQEVFKAVRAPRTLGWSIETADALATSRCRDEQARSNWLASVVGAATEFHSRTSVSQRTMLRLVAQEAGIELPPVLREQAQEVLVQEASARILIYSLDAQATRRVAQALNHQAPKVRVEISEDHTCTPRLRTHARNSDFVVFVASVATHQAFYCIKEALKSSDRLVQVQGTGTTRILDAVMSRLAPGDGVV